MDNVGYENVCYHPEYNKICLIKFYVQINGSRVINGVGYENGGYMQGFL